MVTIGELICLCFFTLYSTHLQDLQEVTQDVHYENYRSERLAKGVAVNRKNANQTNSSAPANGGEQMGVDKEKILQVFFRFLGQTFISILNAKCYYLL